MTYISPDHDLFMGQTHNRGHWRIRPTMDITVHNLGRLSTLSIPMNKLVIYPSLGNIGIYIYIYIYITLDHSLGGQADIHSILQHLRETF